MTGRSEETTRFLEAWLRVRQVVQAANFNRFHQAGLSATQFMTLNVIPEEGLTLSDLARRLNLSPASLKKTIDSLSDRGLVVRQRRKGDARKMDIFCTAKGKKFQNEASTEFHTFMGKLFSSLSAKEKKGLLTGLERLAGIGVAELGDHRPYTATRSLGGVAPVAHKRQQSHRH